MQCHDRKVHYSKTKILNNAVLNQNVRIKSRERLKLSPPGTSNSMNQNIFLLTDKAPSTTPPLRTRAG